MAVFKEIKKFLLNRKHLLRSFLEIVRNGYPAKDLIVIGVTGTDGKSTTCHLIYEILKSADKKVALISTIGAYFNNKEIDTGFHTTTPDAVFLQPLLKKMVKEGVKYLVLETTSHGLDQHRVLGCNFSVGVLTNVTHEHLDYHKTFENYRIAKAKLFKKVKIAVLNKDDPSFAFFKNKANKKAKIISYGFKSPTILKIKKYTFSPAGMKFNLNNNLKFKTKLVGDYNLSNILAAVSVARNLNISWEIIQKAIEKFKGIPGRMEIINLGQPFTAIVDFAHTPNALEKILKTVKNIKNKRSKIIVVFGCAGERDKEKRPKMAKIATELADLAIFTAEDPRSERVEDIISQMIAGTKKKNYLIETDRGKAIKLAVTKAKTGDIVLVCGKGHEKTMCFGKTEIPWSDQETLKKVIRMLE